MSQQPIPANKKTERNAEVFRLSESGLSHKEIGARLGISKSRVGQIVKNARRDRLNTPEVREFLTAVRASNSLDESLPLKKLIASLGLDSRAAQSIMHHFSQTGHSSITLNQLMDLFIPSEGVGEIIWDDIPAGHLLNIGERIYVCVVERLSRVDLGSLFADEWYRRWQRLGQEEWFMSLLLWGWRH